MLNLTRPLAIFDLETTGTNVATDRIVEISILKISPDQKKETLTMRFNPTIPIPLEASLVHGIYDKDVAFEPTFSEVAKKVADFFGDSDLGGFNSNRFDIPLLVEEFMRAGINIRVEDRKLVDVQRIFHMMEERTLSAAYQFYCNKELVNAHSAEADVFATYEVLIAQIEKYSGVLKNNVEALHEFIGDNDFVDASRRFVLKDGKAVFNFGKHKGKAVSQVLREEPQYYDWMMKSDFPLHTKQKLTEIKMQAT